MLYQPEVFVYLMLLPVICLVVLPALFATTRAVIGVLKAASTSETENTFEREALA